MNTKTHCADCGSAFIPTDCTPGYATFGASAVCYPCADKRQVEDLRDRSRPKGGYLNSDATQWTTWTGGKLGRVIRSYKTRAGFHGSWQTIVRVLDVHGKLWHGRGAGEGMCITLRPMKG